MEDKSTKKRSLWSRWRLISEKVGNFQGRVILEVLYAAVFLIPGVILTLFFDRLRIKNKPKTWDDRQKTNIRTLEEAKEQ